MKWTKFYISVIYFGKIGFKYTECFLFRVSSSNKIPMHFTIFLRTNMSKLFKCDYVSMFS